MHAWSKEPRNQLHASSSTDGCLSHIRGGFQKFTGRDCNLDQQMDKRSEAPPTKTIPHVSFTPRSQRKQRDIQDRQPLDEVAVCLCSHWMKFFFQPWWKPPVIQKDPFRRICKRSCPLWHYKGLRLAADERWSDRMNKPAWADFRNFFLFLIFPLDISSQCDARGQRSDSMSI